jgi:hypothetical protein
MHPEKKNSVRGFWQHFYPFQNVAAYQNQLNATESKENNEEKAKIMSSSPF